jgi:hypothetical protein
MGKMRWKVGKEDKKNVGIRDKGGDERRREKSDEYCKMENDRGKVEE